MPIDWSRFATPLLVSVVILFLLFRRIRRSVGRQPLRRNSLRFRLVLLLVVGGMLLLSPTMTPASRPAAILGLLVGAGLAAFSLRHTKLESTSTGQFYTPHVYIGLAVIALLITRMGYRLIQVYSVGGPVAAMGPNAVPAAVSTPLTFGFLFTTIGYYVCYLGGLLWWARRSPGLADGRPPGQAT
jgi:hypothetical protein